MRPEDFFKTVDDVKDSDRARVDNNYMERIVKKYFAQSLDPYTLKSVMKDPLIKPSDKQAAVRELADGLLSRIYFYNRKADIVSVLRKGHRHDVVKELISAAESDECDILVFPVLGLGNWVAHLLGESEEAARKARIVIPGDGITITIQNIQEFCSEHL